MANKKKSDLVQKDVSLIGRDFGEFRKNLIEFSKNFNDVLFSIDTYNSKVAEFALNYGFAIINDISSGKYDSRIIDVVKEYNDHIILGAPTRFFRDFNRFPLSKTIVLFKSLSKLFSAW